MTIDDSEDFALTPEDFALTPMDREVIATLNEDAARLLALLRDGDEAEAERRAKLSSRKPNCPQPSADRPQHI